MNENFIYAAGFVLGIVGGWDLGRYRITTRVWRRLREWSGF